MVGEREKDEEIELKVKVELTPELKRLFGGNGGEEKAERRREYLMSEGYKFHFSDWEGGYDIEDVVVKGADCSD